MQLDIRVGFEPSTGTRHVDQHFWLLDTELATSSLESGDQAAVGAYLSWRRLRTFPITTSTTASLPSVPVPVSKAMNLPSGDQPNTFSTLRGTRARLSPLPAEIRRSATEFPANAT